MLQQAVIRQHTFNELIAKFGGHDQGNGLYVFSTCATAAKKKPIKYPFRSDHYSVFLILEGEFNIKLNLTEYQVKKNELIIVGPTSVREFIDRSKDCTLIGLNFTGEFIYQSGIDKKYIDPFDFLVSHNSTHRQLTEAEANNLHMLFKLLQAKNSSRDDSSFGFEIVRSCFSMVLFELAAIYRKYNAGEKVRLTRKENLALHFLKMLPDHFREERSVQYYAGQLNITPKYLSQSVKELTNKTAGALIDEMVIVEAKVLLHDASLSIAQVANALFFSDQFFFSKFFKSHTGITPSDYRKSA